MRKTVVRLTALLGLVLGCWAGDLRDDFNNSVNPYTPNSNLWQRWFPNNRPASTDMTEANTVLSLKNGATLTAIDPFTNSTVNGRFAIGYVVQSYDGGYRTDPQPNDKFWVMLRSDGVATNSNSTRRLGGINVAFACVENTPETVQIWDNHTNTKLTNASPIIKILGNYNFSVLDDGKTIRVYVEGELVLVYETEVRYGDKIEFCNDVCFQIYPYRNITRVDYLEIIGGVPPPSLALEIASVNARPTARIVSYVTAGESYVLESSVDLVTWVEAGAQFVATASSVTTDIEANETKSFFRMKQIQP